MDLITFLHITFESGCALFCILAALHTRFYRTFSPKMARTLSYGLITNAVINIADMLAYFFRGNTTQTGHVMVRLSNFLVFAGMFILLSLGGALLDNFLERKRTGEDKRLRNATFLVCGAGLLMLVLSRIFGFLYAFDEQNCYYREKSFVLLPMIAVIALALLIVRTVKERKALESNEYAVFMCFWLLPVAGAIAQIFYYGISLSNIANTIALLLLWVVFTRDAVKAISIRKSFILNDISIERISDDLDAFLKGTGTDKQNRIRIRFTLEDALIRLWKKFGDLNMVRVTAGIKFGRPSIKVEHEGDPFNPFSKTGSAEEDWSRGLLSSAGVNPTYTYTHGTNIMRIVLGRMAVNPAITVIISILFGLIIGNVASIALLPADAEFVTQGLLVPVYDLWNNILYCVSAPAMIIIVMSTVLDTREVSEQGGNAGIITGRYFVISILLGVVTFAAAALWKRDAFTTEAFTRYTLSELIRKFFSVVPENFLDPIRDFNTAQLIMMGIVFAYATMAVGKQAGGIGSLIKELDLVTTQLAAWIAGLVPIFTVFLTAQLVLMNNADLLLDLVLVFPFAIILSLIVMLLTLLYVSRSMNVSPMVLAKKMWPSFLLTLKTGQMSESYALAEQCCRKELGIQSLFTQRVMPLGLVLYMPISIIGMVAFVIYAAIRSNIVITPVWMITAIVFALILLIAAPPIPGVDLLSYVVIIGQLGIGKEYILAAMIFDIIFNLFASAANQMMLQTDLVLQADRVGLLDRKKLGTPPAE